MKLAKKSFSLSPTEVFVEINQNVKKAVLQQTFKVDGLFNRSRDRLIFMNLKNKKKSPRRHKIL